MDELGLKHNETELVLTLEDKKNYLVHYRNLQFSQSGNETQEGCCSLTKSAGWSHTTE